MEDDANKLLLIETVTIIICLALIISVYNFIHIKDLQSNYENIAVSVKQIEEGEVIVRFESEQLPTKVEREKDGTLVITVNNGGK